jgi:hypothetical protein
MSDWSWKQTVAERIVELVNSTKSDQFFLADVYAIESMSCVRIITSCLIAGHYP